MAVFTQATLDLLDAAMAAAIADGTWRVQNTGFSDNATAFISWEEAQKLRAFIASQLSVANGTRTRYARTSKGV